MMATESFESMDIYIQLFSRRGNESLSAEAVRTI
jgi:hypothetical protein